MLAAASSSGSSYMAPRIALRHPYRIRVSSLRPVGEWTCRTTTSGTYTTARPAFHSRLQYSASSP